MKQHAINENDVRLISSSCHLYIKYTQHQNKSIVLDKEFANLRYHISVCVWHRHEDWFHFFERHTKKQKCVSFIVKLFWYIPWFALRNHTVNYHTDKVHTVQGSKIPWISSFRYDFVQSTNVAATKSILYFITSLLRNQFSSSSSSFRLHTIIYSVQRRIIITGCFSSFRWF